MESEEGAAAGLVSPLGKDAATLADTLRFDAEGLIPAIAQDAATGDVLMLAWMNSAAVRRTIQTREATYFSRSRNELWVKGATSGNRQHVVGIAVDCDDDTILLQVEQSGPACHTGTRTCFTGRDVPLPAESE